jgi:hypothetical protein
MDLGETIHIWRKRWILTLTLLILASAGAVAAVTGLPRAYSANSSLVLLASRSAARQNGGNPYLSFSPSLTLTADALSRELMAPTTINALAAKGFNDIYTVELAPYTTTTTGSVLLITTAGHDRTTVELTLHEVISEIGVKLAELQGSVGPRHRIRVVPLSLSPQATLSIGQTARPLVAAIAPLLLLAFGIPVVVDGWAARRRGRRRSPAVLAEPPLDSRTDARATTAPGEAILDGALKSAPSWPG